MTALAFRADLLVSPSQHLVEVATVREHRNHLRLGDELQLVEGRAVARRVPSIAIRRPPETINGMTRRRCAAQWLTLCSASAESGKLSRSTSG